MLVPRRTVVLTALVALGFAVIDAVVQPLNSPRQGSHRRPERDEAVALAHS